MDTACMSICNFFFQYGTNRISRLKLHTSGQEVNRRKHVFLQDRERMLIVKECYKECFIILKNRESQAKLDPRNKFLFGILHIVDSLFKPCS